MTRHTLKFFINRIGKRIYRKPIDSCGCACCQSTYVDIWDGIARSPKQTKCRRDFHARYLKTCQDELGIEYFDKPLKAKK